MSSGFGGTDLDEHLLSIGVETTAVCGLLTNTCIESTAPDGVDLSDSYGSYAARRRNLVRRPIALGRHNRAHESLLPTA